ncbi:MAG: hypothetical protein ACOYOE_05570 [Chlorobium sp.]
MSPRFPSKKFTINWLKALLLSPGVLFPAGYLLVYLSTNIFLNADFKKNIAHSVHQATGNTWQVNIKSLKSGLILDSVTLNDIELTPARTPESNLQPPAHTITIQTLEIPCPNLEKLLFSPKERLLSTQVICKKILSDERIVQ